MIHFDRNALTLIALQHWAREGRDMIDLVLDDGATAVCPAVCYEYPMGPIENREAKLAKARRFVNRRIS